VEKKLLATTTARASCNHSSVERRDPREYVTITPAADPDKAHAPSEQTLPWIHPQQSTGTLSRFFQNRSRHKK
jgi:hypothetical protein